MIQRLVLVRHEESVANRDLYTGGSSGQLFYARPGSDKAVPLSKLGRRRARKLGSQLATLGPFRRVFVSEYLRTRQTIRLARHSAQSLPPAQKDSRLNKRGYGLFWNLTYKGVETLHPQEYQRFLTEGALAYRPPEGESYIDLFARVQSFLDGLNELDGNLLVVTHSAVILAFARLIEGLTAQEVVRLYEEQAVKNGQLVVYEAWNNALRRI